MGGGGGVSGEWVPSLTVQSYFCFIACYLEKKRDLFINYIGYCKFYHPLFHTRFPNEVVRVP